MHIGVFGQTESGKGVIAKRLINKLKGTLKTLLLDPIGDTTFNADYQTTDTELFLKVVFMSKNCLVVVDECGESVGHYNKPMFKLATRSRHLGHSCLFLAQRAKLIHPTVRNNCSAVYVFSQAFDDCKVLANDFNDKELLKAADLKAGEYIYKRRHHPAKFFKLFDK